ncbi:hemagglutinin repeat-containing protein [Pseudomonas fluorescens]|uniref:two-partner secretion domain-containing protein n=1 Tax=Pseudomonas fluorescens TaxID=294 RepID=UPI00380C5DAD
MDVRHYAFAARQSCSIETREHFWGMPKRGLALLLANVMFWQPMWAQADGIVVANSNTSLDRAGNGVPIINIATPNGSGLSHNQFHDYNVGAQGVILNNGATQTSATQLGGHIIGNPNLKNSGSAQAILNEVISGNPSQLRGYTEVAGQSARVIVANPYGITCNGCGFINAPRVTLTTGKPVLDGAGRLDRFQVDQGSVAIEGAGLNANNVDRFEIITRSAKINAELQAQNLTIVAGRNDVNAQTLNATARADDGSAKPQLAIDSSALGGMYAGAIKLVGTEAGVGVKLAGNVAASGGDIQIDANGQLTLAQASATTSVNVKAASLDAQGPVYAGTGLNVQTKGNLTNRQTLAARDSINLSAGGQLNNAGAIEAGVNADGSRNTHGDLKLNAQNLENQGKSLTASRNLTVIAAQTLNNQGGLLSGQTTAVTAGTLDNRNNGRVLSRGTLNVKANQVQNMGGLINSAGDLQGVVGQLDNSAGEISSTRTTRLNGLTLNNRSGRILGDLGLDIDLGGALDNRDGMLGSGQVLSLKAGSFDNRDGGVVVSDNGLVLRINGLLDNRDKGEITTKGSIDAQTGSLDNRTGKVIGKNSLALRGDSVDNRGGIIQADKQLNLQINRLDNRDKGQITGKAAMTLQGNYLDNSGGLFSAVGPVTLTLDEVHNAQGRISSQADLLATIGLLQQQGGALVAQGNLSLIGNSLDNRNGGLVGTTKALKLNVDQVDNRAGELSATLLIDISGKRLDNADGGKLLAGADLTLAVATLNNQSKGLISAKGATGLIGSSLNNSGGRLESLKGLIITLDDAMLNIQGLISSEGTLTVAANRIDNSAGILGSAGALALTTQGEVINQDGSLSTDGTLNLRSGSLDNSRNGSVSAKDVTLIHTGDMDNSQGGHLISGASLELKANQVNNAGGRIASQQAMTVSVTGLNQQAGELFSKDSLSLDLNNGDLDNRNGLINAPGTLLLKNLAGVNNQGGEISSRLAFTLAVNELDNSQGKLLSQEGLTLRIAHALNNLKGVISAAAVDAQSNSLDNAEGLISSHGRLELAVGKDLNNHAGTLIADGQLLLEVGTLDNRAGSIASKTNALLAVRKLDNRQGKLIATGTLGLNAETLDNRQSGLLGATQDVTLNVGDVDNRGGEITSNTQVSITGDKLDNSDAGKMFAGQALALTVDQLFNRNDGLISSRSVLNLQGRTLDNSGGNLLSLHAARLDLSGAFDNSRGKVSSEGELTVNTAQLTNALGSLSSAGDLTVNSQGAVDNQGGNMVTNGALGLVSTRLDNHQKGTISAKGAVTVTTGAFDNSQSGQLNSASTVNLNAGQVSNSDGGRIGSEGALTASVSGLDQQGGQLFSKQSLILDMNNGQLNNQNGLINAPGALLLKQLNGVNNQGGEISSAQAFTLIAQNFDNSNGGKLLSGQGLIVRIANALDNVKGVIGAAAIDLRSASLNNSGGSLVSRGNLDLTVDGLLRNDARGLINAEQALHLNSADLNNEGGAILAKDAITLDAMALNNRGNGLINSLGALSVTATTLDSSNGGEVSAKGDINLKLTALTQNGGRLLGDNAISVDLAEGDFDNRNGLLTAKGPLTLERLRDLNNEGGEISSALAFDVIARALNNSSGKLISSQKLTVSGTELINRKGLMSGWESLAVKGASLDNRDSGTLSSRNGDVGVELTSGLLNSHSGALVSHGSLNVKASELDNSDKGILSSAAGQTLTLSGTLNNNQGGLIDSGVALDISSAALTNAGGTINAQQVINVNATSVDNSTGQIAGNAAITLGLLGQLNNNAGKLAGAGPVRITGVTDLSNRSGQLVSQGNLSLLTGSLDNSNKGTIAANDDLQITASGAVLNHSDGLIYSQNAGLQLKAASLANGKGAIQSQSGLALDVSGDLDNQSGRVIAETGAVSVNASNIDNRGGVLASIKGALQARTVGVLRNGVDLNNNHQGGIIQAQGLTLTALAGLDNNGGRISAQAADASIVTAALDNRNGGLYAKNLLRVTGTRLDNGGGQIAGNRIDLDLLNDLNNRGGVVESDTTLSVKAASLDNQGGKLRSLANSGKTAFQIGGLLDNRNGVLETGNTDLTLAVGSFLNSGGQLLHLGDGTFDISTANVTGAGGSIVTRGGLTLNADTWSNSSVIQAGRLNVNVNNFSQTASGQLLASTHLQGRGGNWVNDGLIASDGSMDLQLGGSYGGNGRVSSVGDLTFGAAHLTVNEGASVAGGGLTKLNVGGQVTNMGRLTSADALEIRAGAVSNLGTLASAKNLLINAQTLTNNRIRANQGSLLFSGAHMNLQVGTLTNTYSDVYSLGDINMLGYNGADRAARVDNLSGRIESTGDMSLKSSVVNNKMENFSVITTEGDSSSIGVRCFNCDSARPKHMEDVDSHLVWQQTFNVTVSGDADASSITAGRNLSVTGSEFVNSNSTVSAASDITINVDTFNNSGSSLGSYSSLKYITNKAPNDALWNQIVNYNSHNDASYNKDIRFWTAGGAESSVTPWLRNNPHILETSTQYIGTYGKDATGGGYITFGASQYASGVRVQAPAAIINATPFQTVITESTDKSYVPAIVQAGGSVVVNATNKITNGELRSYTATAGGPAKTADTRTGAGTQPTVISLNRQLPPDLAQQQVNPLALPGFELPGGQNGLFRLSGQGATSGGTAPLPGAQNWTIGGASVTTTQRQADLPSGGRTLTIDPINAVGAADRQLTTADRTGLQPTTGASAIDASINDGSGTLIGAPNTSPKGNVSQTLARVQGLPNTPAPSNAHKYLIETNPVLTELKQFMSSDYLLANLGYDPDQSAKRLGDGLYEQRLIQQAVVERTGQRFIDGQTSDEGLFKYLMNNAIASKDQLDLSVGVTLTAEQVAALTHDIVWLEEHEVNGEKVLVPVLYLAQANNRLAPNGALIQGANVKLIAGQDLQNAGTLRASNNLTAAAGNDLVNSGLIEAGNRLDLLAGNNIVNKSGGIITGRGVNLVSVKGDIINERTVTSSGFASQGYSQHREYLDNASRIEATNDLKASAGRDFISTGSALVSGRDTSIEAGRDASILSAQSNNSAFTGATTSSVHQVGSTATAGRDFSVNAGRDLTVIGSQISAARDIEMSADRDLLIGSAEEESHSYYKSKKVTAQEDHIDQIASSISAGGKAGFVAGKDLTVVSSRITAGDEAYLVAGNDLEVLAAEDYDYSLYDKKKKGSLGRKETRHDEVTKVKYVGSEISSGGDLTLVSGGDQRYQAANLNAGKDLTISSGGDLTFESVTDLEKESHEKSKTSLAWTSAKGAGQTDETVRQSDLLAAGDIIIKAAGDIRIDVKEVTQKSVADSIDAMVKADPQLAWLKDMQDRGDIDWHMIKEVHDQWDYQSSGMGMGAAIAVAIIVTVLTAGAASAAIGGMASGTGSTFAAATATTAAGAGNVALTAVITSMASTAAVSAINNKGNLADTLKDVLSEENIKSYVTAAIIAGAGSYTGEWGTKIGPQGNKITISVTERLKAFAVNTALKGLLTGDGSDKSWLTIAGTGALAEIYAYWTGRGPDVRSGEDRAGGPKVDQLDGGLVAREWVAGEWIEGKNIGLNDSCTSLLAVCHGTLISNIANSVPGMNAFATLHDTWMNKLIIAKDGVNMTWWENLGTMPPALAVNYGALYDKYRPLIEQTKRESRE